MEDEEHFANTLSEDGADRVSFPRILLERHSCNSNLGWLWHDENSKPWIYAALRGR